MARKLPPIGKPEVTFMVAIVILLSMTAGAVLWGRAADPTLVAAAIGLVGLPVVFSSERKRDDR